MTVAARRVLCQLRQIVMTCLCLNDGVPFVGFIQMSSCLLFPVDHQTLAVKCPGYLLQLTLASLPYTVF